MRYGKMGYQFRAFFISIYGVPFHKDFRTRKEMEEFILKAREAGSEYKKYKKIFE